MTHQTGYKPARPARRNHTYRQILSLSSVKCLPPARGGDSEGMAEAWPVAHEQREHAYLHMWAPKAWPGCPPFARRAVEGCAFTLLLPHRRSRWYPCSSMLASGPRSSRPRGTRSLSAALLGHMRPGAPSSNMRKPLSRARHSGLGKVISRLPSRGRIHL